MAWTDPRTWIDGELVTASLLNTHLRDNLDNLREIRIRKTADESVTSNASLQDDNDFFFPVDVNEIWHVQLWLFFGSTSTTPDFRWGFTAPAGCSGYAGELGPAFSVTDGDEELSTFHFGLNLAGGFRLGSGGFPRQTAFVWATVVNGANAGTVQFQWCQDTSNATAMILYQNSVLIAKRIS